MNTRQIIFTVVLILAGGYLAYHTAPKVISASGGSFYMFLMILLIGVVLFGIARVMRA